MKRTDLALELAPRKHIKSGKGAFSGYKTPSHCKVSRVDVDAKLAKLLKKPVGTYVTIESRAVPEMRRDRFKDVSRVLGRELAHMVGAVKSVMVVGLGNPNMTADSLGVKVAAKLMVTRHINVEGAVALSVVTPNVLGVTGIASFDVVAGVAERVKPQLIIAIDSLASAAVHRISSAFQLSDSGITPGSGVSNHCERLDRESLGIRVISLGVPLVVYASTIIEDAMGENKGEYSAEIGSMVVTPKDIDLYVEDCAEILSDAVNGVFFG